MQNAFYLVKLLTLADFLHIKTNRIHPIKSTAVVVGFTLDRPKEI